MFCQCGGIVNIIDPIPRKWEASRQEFRARLRKNGDEPLPHQTHFCKIISFWRKDISRNHVWSRFFGVVAKFRTALTRPCPPDWSSPSSWLLANKGLVSMPSCGYVEKCWFWAKERDYMEGELKGDSMNSRTCAEVSLGTTDPPQFLREVMHGNALHLQNYLLEYAPLWSLQSHFRCQETRFAGEDTPSEWVSSLAVIPHVAAFESGAESHMCLIWTSFLLIWLHCKEMAGTW